jgi:hypothetical protein
MKNGGLIVTLAAALITIGLGLIYGGAKTADAVKDKTNYAEKLEKMKKENRIKLRKQSLKDAGQAKRMITPPDGTGKYRKWQKMTPVEFDHSKHQYDCKKCHHKWQEDKQSITLNVKPCTASGCHDLNHPEDKSKIRFYQKALHQRCRGCHRDMAGKHTGPTKCQGGCHVSIPEDAF